MATTASTVLGIPEKVDETPIFSDLRKEPEKETTYPIKVRADQDVLEARAQELFYSPYSDKEGYDRTWGQLLSQPQIISLTKRMLLDEGDFTEERLGWSPQDIENVELALEKFDFFIDLPQDLSLIHI